MKIFRSADYFVNRIGLGDNLIEPTLRHSRWLSLGALVSLTAGAAILLLSLSGIVHGFGFGMTLYLIASVAAAILQYVGPLRRATAGPRLMSASGRCGQRHTMSPAKSSGSPRLSAHGA